MPYDVPTPWPKKSLPGYEEKLDLYDELYFSHIRQGAKHLSVSKNTITELKQMLNYFGDSVCYMKLRHRIQDMLPLAQTTAEYHWDLTGQLPRKENLPFFVWSGENDKSRSLYIREGDNGPDYNLSIDIQARDRVVIGIYESKKFSMELRFENDKFESGERIAMHETVEVSSIEQSAQTWSKFVLADQLHAYMTQSNLSNTFKDACAPFLRYLTSVPHRPLPEIFPDKIPEDIGLLRSVLFATRTR